MIKNGSGQSRTADMELQSIALPTELLNRNGNNNGGLDGNRTRDLLRDEAGVLTATLRDLLNLKLCIAGGGFEPPTFGL